MPKKKDNTELIENCVRMMDSPEDKDFAGAARTLRDTCRANSERIFDALRRTFGNPEAEGEIEEKSDQINALSKDNQNLKAKVADLDGLNKQLRAGVLDAAAMKQKLEAEMERLVKGGDMIREFGSGLWGFIRSAYAMAWMRAACVSAVIALRIWVMTSFRITHSTYMNLNLATLVIVLIGFALWAGREYDCSGTEITLVKCGILASTLVGSIIVCFDSTAWNVWVSVRPVAPGDAYIVLGVGTLLTISSAVRRVGDLIASSETQLFAFVRAIFL